MHYLATIKYGTDSHTQSCSTEKEAQQWLDSQNNNLQHTTVITVLDDEWRMVSSYYYTQGEEE